MQKLAKRHAALSRGRRRALHRKVQAAAQLDIGAHLAVGHGHVRRVQRILLQSGGIGEGGVQHQIGRGGRRNCATVGGSIFGRFGFSDVLTCFLALDTEVELYPSGRISLSEFVCQPKNKDILTHIII